MTAWYNEIDPVAAETLRNLIAAGHIAPGVVDERSIEDVRPDELVGYTQCHFFAGVGIWSYALRQAGWTDDRAVWTGSCPCQPFSTAGKGDGFADERHLWPAWFHLVTQRMPAAIFGEQVASKTADPWIDLVHADLEALGYAFGCLPFPAAGVGAPHIRDRNYWVAYAAGAGLQGDGSAWGSRPWWQGPTTERGSQDGGLADADRDGRESRSEGFTAARHGQASESYRSDGRVADTGCTGLAQQRGGRIEPKGLTKDGTFGRMADAVVQQRQNREPGLGIEHDANGRVEGSAAAAGFCSDLRPGPVNGLWRDADWLYCRDGRWRPVEPGTFPLADGTPGRVGRLRMYGNGICAAQAQAFIESVMP